MNRPYGMFLASTPDACTRLVMANGKVTIQRLILAHEIVLTLAELAEVTDLAAQEYPEGAIAQMLAGLVPESMEQR